MQTITITCDRCGADITHNDPTALMMRIRLTWESRQPGTPRPEAELHFCDAKCLREHVAERIGEGHSPA